jgi:hypothetical protein
MFVIERDRMLLYLTLEYGAESIQIHPEQSSAVTGRDPQFHVQLAE